MVEIGIITFVFVMLTVAYVVYTFTSAYYRREEESYWMLVVVHLVIWTVITGIFGGIFWW